ncbi:S-formylglutathione hydrolase [Tahibacter amnicola]|uniref:S-formylglutathione hydrolase n=1 Tax=Tahibacter amnicola TaxID=2976241 RepID=A0ABY6BDU3_9GAMM|nr:S-formylglutathione hydrolase [Tahibacter amnicola]UXI68194.1 S-formylglutathione hydrolase [Tahibacter amnicola]
MTTTSVLSRQRCFDGWQEVREHRSAVLDCTMRFGVYLPPQASERPCPVLYWLSGLTCTEQNFITKAGAQRYAAEHGVILVAPDTSPRGAAVPDDPAYDLGQGAGFYVNATQAPWSSHYCMFDYIVDELPQVVESSVSSSGRRGIFGHSMGGHGALVIALRRPDRYASVSAFSPIVAPSEVPWGQKALTAYLGADRVAWRAWDACEQVRLATARLPLRVDQGDADEFLQTQLQPERLEAACRAAGYPLDLRRHAGYDHSYYFIASFIGEHIAWHAAAMS